MRRSISEKKEGGFARSEGGSTSNGAHVYITVVMTLAMFVGFGVEVL